MPIQFVDEGHEERFRSILPLVASDRYREPLAYLMASNRMLWLSVQEGRRFQQPNPPAWKPNFRAPNGATVMLSNSETVLADLAWALFHGGKFGVTRLNELDGVEWRIAMEALRISRCGAESVM